MRAIPARLFIEQNGDYRLLEGVTLDTLACGPEIEECTLRGRLPLDWNPYRPQNLHLVYQDADNDGQFFDPQKIGHIETLTGFRIIRDSNVLMLIRNVTTGEVTIPTPEYQCTFASELEVDDEVNYADT